MLGKIKEYVIKNLFFKKNIPIETGPSQDDAASEDPKKSQTAGYLKTRHPLEGYRRSTNQSRESPTKRSMKHCYSAIPVDRLDWSRKSRQTLK
jgi:hypothetical protein